MFLQPKKLKYKKIRKGKLLGVRVFPDIPILLKPAASRMGKGKGSIPIGGVKVSGGTVLFEMCGIKDPKIILSAFKTGGHKLSIKTRILN